MNQTVEALAKKEATATEIINWYIPAIFSLLHHFMKPWVLADRTHTQQLSHFKTKKPREAPPHPTTEEVSSTLWRPLTHHPCSPRTPVFFFVWGITRAEIWINTLLKRIQSQQKAHIHSGRLFNTSNGQALYSLHTVLTRRMEGKKGKGPWIFTTKVKLFH